MAKLKDIIGEEVFKHLPQEKQKEYENRDYEDISSGAYIPKKRFDKVNEDAKAYKIQMIEKEKEILDLKDQYKDVDGLRSKITELQDANKMQKEVYDKQLKDVAFNNALEKGIDTFNVKDKTLIMTLLNKENLKFNGETIEGLKEQMEFIKKERDYLFEKEINGTSSFSTGGTEFTSREKKNFATELGKEKAAMNTRGIEAFTK
ncbi:phage minor structural protein GP20 [Clostridium saccharobutylicum]|uniref:phage scaffolding protein n=1 Tax=Clostridium saccharobutylicum TaxID=169679 RepID=UPI000983D1AD|nr:phage scaffolding protein [Clostridium saccharobutylicum]AQS11319.1 phage minor structural protein GP20 [Clostridium saccharobutylicum]MBC2437140.1 phage capsid protein [Clostridium saccharobutylicum]NSB88712.1 hypothetical protein [Clostridium saccharobutylicum]NYC30710.1 hypothetical protein [Clostridium saccharobutylicum]OOM15409.1 phage minor structural protein GP20 [Clostridium saccharobutylicum]